MNPSNFISVSTTVPSLEAAKAIARRVMEARLAACCHLSPIESMYVWNGEVASDLEYVVSFKTTQECFERIHQLLKVKGGHPYKLPALYAVPWVAVTEEYAAWIQALVVR